MLATIKMDLKLGLIRLPPSNYSAS